MGKEPSSIHSKKLHKFTKRRLLKTLVAAGMAPAAASRLTVDDVKAADSDQVPIALDTEGEHIKNVSADWYDRLTHARKVRAQIAQEKQGKSNILGVGVSAGSRGGENPNLIVHHDKEKEQNSKSQENRESERDGVEVKHNEVTNQQPNTCVDGVCNNYDCDPLPAGEDIPGGAVCDIIHPQSGWCTHTSRILDADRTYDGSWLTAAHCTPSCSAENTTVYHQDYSDLEQMGEIVEVYPEYDAAIIAPTDRDASVDVAESTDLDNGERYPIKHTLSKDGVSFWQSEGRSVFRYGGGTCYDDGTVDQIVPDYSVGDGYCADQLKETVHLEMNAGDGDSGGPAFCYYEEEDMYYGLYVHSGSYDNFFIQDMAYGVPGYKLQNDLGYYWK